MGKVSDAKANSEKTMDKVMTLSDCLHAVYEFVNKGDDYEFRYKGANMANKIRPDAEYAYLRQTLDLTDQQIDLFAVILEDDLDGMSHSDRVADKLGITKIKLLSLKPDLDVLASKRYILFNADQVSYMKFIVPRIVVNAVAQNRKPTIKDLEGYSVPKFVKQLDALYATFNGDQIDFKTLLSELDILYSCNPQNPLVVAYNNNNLKEDLDPYENSLFNYMLYRYLGHNDNCFAWQDYCKLFVESDMCDEIMECVEQGELILMKKGLVEHDITDGMGRTDYIRLTENALKQFARAKSKGSHKQYNPTYKIISHDEIAPKQLFFNDSECKELDRLCNLLQKDNYDQVTERLKEKGMRRGVACLFYGAPGTGKTASCYNLCSETGRDIYFVDMAQIKSKWVGESEENLSNLFKAYRDAVRTAEVTPIMVWNEADAIFGKRRNVTSAVDKMENAMQNIILQELEDLEGILIATTNFSLKDGFDPAMERRFLIKVGFGKPEIDTRVKIWQSMFTQLSDADARTLATEYDFAGGQIENINRKATVDYILKGSEPTLDYLRELCRTERLGAQAIGRIGF